MKRKGEKSKEWLRFRRQYIKERKDWDDRWTCTRCGDKTEYPKVGHSKKRSSYPEYKYDLDNIAIYCPDCETKNTLENP